MDNEFPMMAKLREWVISHGGLAAADQTDERAAQNVDASSDTAKGYADGGIIAESNDAKMAKADDRKSDGEAGKAPALPVSPLQKVMDGAAHSPIQLNIHPGQVGVTYQKRFADGGIVEKKNAHEPKAPEGPSDDEKRKCVEKAIKEGAVKLDDGGMVPSGPLPVDAPQESKLQAILQAIGMAGKNAVSSVLPGTQALTNSVAPAAASAASAPGIAPSVNAALGTHLEDPPMPPTAPVPEAQPPTPPPAPMPAPAMPPQAKAAPMAHPGPDPLSQLGKFDPNTVTPGLNPADRQALANGLQANQHTFGNYLAEAVAGLGDAVAAKGGVQQNSLGNIFALQTQQRQEALDNFDKARQAAVDHFTMKNQADQALVNNLKARGELQVTPGIANALGHPELAGKPVAQADLVLKTDAMKYDFANKMTERKQAALKNSAEEIDKALTHGGMFGTQKMMDPKSRLNMIHTQAIKNDPEAFGYSVSPTGK